MWVSTGGLTKENHPKEEAIKPFNGLLGVKSVVQSYVSSTS